MPHMANLWPALIQGAFRRHRYILFDAGLHAPGPGASPAVPIDVIAAASAGRQLSAALGGEMGVFLGRPLLLMAVVDAAWMSGTSLCNCYFAVTALHQHSQQTTSTTLAWT